MDLEVKLEIGKTTIKLGKHPLVGIEIKIEVEEITVGTIIDPIIEIGQETTIGMIVEETTTDQMIDMTITDQTIGETITDKMIGETIIDKTIEGTITEMDQIMVEMLSKDIEIEMKAGRIQEIIIVTIQEKDLSEVEIETGVEIGVEIDKCDQE